VARPGGGRASVADLSVARKLTASTSACIALEYGMYAMKLSARRHVPTQDDVSASGLRGSYEPGEELCDRPAKGLKTVKPRHVLGEYPQARQHIGSDKDGQEQLKIASHRRSLACVNSRLRARSIGIAELSRLSNPTSHDHVDTARRKANPIVSITKV